MQYWLTTLGLISAIDDTIPAPSPKPSSVRSSSVETPPTTPSSYIYLKPEEIDYHCLHIILSALSDSLYDIYYEYKSARQHSRMNMASMMLESKDSPPPPSINS